MPISGSDKALMFALAGRARAGATRSGYHSGQPFVSIAGVQSRSSIDMASLVVVDELNDRPNTCAFTLLPGGSISKGAEVIVTLGSINNLERLFAGHVLRLKKVYVGTPGHTRINVDCRDYGWQFDRRKVTKRYTNQSGTAILQDLVAGVSDLGFSSLGVQDGLDTIDEMSFPSVERSVAFSQVCERLGAEWYIDGQRVVHVFVGDESGVTNPRDITSAHPTVKDFVYDEDLSQIITRVVIAGQGSRVLALRTAGDTTIPVENAAMFSASGGTIEAGPQYLTYTGKQAGGTASVVMGPAVTIAAPTTAVIDDEDGDINDANARYGIAFVKDGGETTIGTLSTELQAKPQAPTTAPTLTPFEGAGGLDALATYKFRVAFMIDGQQTELGAESSVTLTGAQNAISLSNLPISPRADCTARWIYRTEGNGSTFYRAAIVSDNTTTSNTIAGAISDATLVANGAAHSTNATLAPVKVVLTGIPTGPSGTTARKIFRRRADDATYGLVERLTNTDPTAPASAPTLSASTGGSFDATATYSCYVTFLFNGGRFESARSPVASITLTGSNRTITVSNIPVSAEAGCVGRVLYLTEGGGSTAMRLHVLEDNVETTAIFGATSDADLDSRYVAPTAPRYIDAKRDDDLGDAPLEVSSVPTLVASTTLRVADTAQFLAGGGWVTVGNQTLLYTGRSAASGEANLTGIPASGVGSILTKIQAGSEAIATPHLTGIPSSTSGAIIYDIEDGDEVNLLIQYDDAAAQAALAALIGGDEDGIQEEYLKDTELSETEALERAEAIAERRKSGIASIAYFSRDVRTRSGRTVTVSLGAPTSVSADFRIQHVRIQDFHTNENLPPTFLAQASSERFSLEGLLRVMRRAVGEQ